MVTVSIVARGDDPPARVTLRDGGATLAVLMGSGVYGYAWDTRLVAEGAHTLVAETTYADRIITSPAVSVVVDRTPPRIVSLSPAAGAADVVRRAPLRVAFSEPILPSTFGASAVQVTHGAPVAAIAALAADGLSATITVAGDAVPTLPATYTAAFAPAVTDLAGNELVVPPATWSWTVPAWLPLAAALRSSAEPLLVIGSDLRPIVAHDTASVETAGIPATVSVSKHDGQSWSPLGAAIPTAGGHTLAVDAAADPVLAYTTPTANGVAIAVRAWKAGAWQAPLPPLDALAAAGSDALTPHLRLDIDDRPFVAWKETLGASAAEIFVARWTGTAWDRSFGGLGFSTAGGLDLELITSGVDPVDAVATPVATPVLGWQSELGFGVSIWEGTRWTRSAPFAACAPRVELDATGRPLMEHGGRGLPIGRFAGGAWGTVDAPALDAAVDPVDSRLAAGPHGALAITWREAGVSRLALWRGAGPDWDTRPGALAGVSPASGTTPQVVFDARGAAWVAWREAGSTVNVSMSNY